MVELYENKTLFNTNYVINSKITALCNHKYSMVLTYIFIHTHTYRLLFAGKWSEDILRRTFAHRGAPLLHASKRHTAKCMCISASYQALLCMCFNTSVLTSADSYLCVYVI